MNNETPEPQYSVVLDKVVNAKEMLAVTRLLASRLQNNPYITVGDFMLSVSDDDLYTLNSVAESEENDHFSELILIAEMLAVGEGVYVRDINAVTERINYFRMLLVVESLHRKGMIEAVHRNMSFGDDSKHKIIAKKIE